jgi:hypothetical protein
MLRRLPACRALILSVAIAPMVMAWLKDIKADPAKLPHIQGSNP